MGKALGRCAHLDLGHHMAGFLNLSGLPKRAGGLHPRKNEPIHPRDHRAEMGDRMRLRTQQDLRMARGNSQLGGKQLSMKTTRSENGKARLGRASRLIVSP